VPLQADHISAAASGHESCFEADQKYHLSGVLSIALTCKSMQRKGGHAQQSPPNDLSLEQMVEAYRAMVIEKAQQISKQGGQPINVGQLLGSIMEAEIGRRGYAKPLFKSCAQKYETSKCDQCKEFQELKRKYDCRDGLLVAPKEKSQRPPPKELTEQEKRDGVIRALGFNLEERDKGSCVLDRRSGSLYLSCITNYPEFQPDLQKFVLGIAEKSKRASPETKKSFRAFVLSASRTSLDSLPDVDLDASRLRLSTIIADDRVFDLNTVAELQSCAAYVEAASCTAMALDVEKSPLSVTWKQLKPALIQIADHDRVFLLHSNMLSSGAETIALANRIFAALLSRGRTLAVFGSDDLSMLRKLDFLSLPDHPLCNLADMQKMCLSSPSLTAHAGSKRGLADWVAIKWPGSVLSKTWTLSGWDIQSPLLRAQLEYALPSSSGALLGLFMLCAGTLLLMQLSRLRCGSTAKRRKMRRQKALDAVKFIDCIPLMLSNALQPKFSLHVML
jgi:hypothetical protein